MGKYFESKSSARRLSDSAKLRQYEKENNIVNPRNGDKVSLTTVIDSQASVLKNEGKKQISDKLSAVKSPTELAKGGLGAINLQTAKKATDKTLGVEKTTDNLNLLHAADYYLGMKEGYVQPEDTEVDVAKKAISYNAAGVKDAERYVGKATDYDGDGKISIKDAAKLQKDNQTDGEKFVVKNIGKIEGNIKDSEEYKIGDSYIIGLEGSPYGFSKFEGIKYLEEKEKDNLKYLLGKKLKEKGYNTTRAGLLGADEFLTEAESSGEFDELSDAYLDALKETLNKREAEDIYSKIEDKPALEVAEMLRLGLGSNPEGIYRSLAFGKDNTAKTTRDYLTDMINEDLSDDGPKLPDWLGGRSLGQMAGSLAQSYGQMLPSMALSAIPYAGPVLSSVSFGMSAGGNAKVELMREGYDETTATIYGMLVGSAEAGLEKLMGSIPGLGSSASKGLTKGIKNAFLRAAANYGIDVVGEAVEESAQEILDPVFKSLATRDFSKMNELDWGEVAYAGLQGAIMAGGTNVVKRGSELKSDLSPNFKNPTIENYKALDELIRKGLEGDVKSDFYKESKRLNGMIQKSYDKAVAEGKSAEAAAVESIRRLTINDVERVLTAQNNDIESVHKSAIKNRLAELGYDGNAKLAANGIYKVGQGEKYYTLREADAIKGNHIATRVKNEYKGRFSGGYSSKWAENIGNVTSDNAARTNEHKNGIAAKVISTGGSVGIVGVEYSDGQGEENITYRTSEGKVIKSSDLEFDLDYMGYTIKTAAESLPTESANALIKTADVYREYAGSNASSDKLISSFMDLREAAAKGMTFEQASNDIRLSGDISQLGEAAARIAINDGLAMYTQEQAKAEKAKTDKKAEHKKAVPVKGAVRVAEDVKVTSSMKANMHILKRIARSGDVAVVIEKFSGAESASKGYYDGVLHLNAEKLSEGGFSYTGIHESVHHVARVNPEGYKSIEKFIENYYKEKGVDIKAEIKATQDLYKRRGVELTAEAAMEEIVCNTLSDIATDADALTAFMGLDGKAQNNFIEALKAIARKLKDWANKCLGNTEYHSVVLKDADTLLSLAKKFRAELENAGQKNNTADNSDVKYAFGGQKANNAPSLYLKAERMAENGVDNETIRQETGWFKGYDDMWRFEIDDSEMKVALNGKYSRDPQIRRYTELTDKVYFQNDYTQSEFDELQELDKKLESKSVEPKKLGDLIEHKKLFEAYPQLQEISVVFESDMGNTRGVYDSVFNEIVLNNNLRFNPEQFKKTLVHEIQHAIQNIEGFAYGSSPEYWESAKHRYTAKEKEQSEQIKWDIYNMERAVKKEFGSEAWRNIVKYKTLQDIYVEEDIDTESLEKQLEDIENEAEEQGYNEWLDKYYYAKSDLDSIDRRVERRKHRSNEELYLYTAGEIEARDVSNRVDLTEEQRKNTQPDIKRMGVVFSDYGLSMDYLEEDEALFNPDKLTFDSILKDVLKTAKEEDSRYIYLGRFPAEIVEKIKKYYDIKDLPVVMNYRDTYLAMEAKENGRFKAQGVNYHNLGDTGLTELKNNFANPDYVIKHKSSDKIELIYPQLDYKKRTVYCIVILNTDTKHSKEKLDVHVMTTAYGKAKIEKYVEVAIEEGRLIYSKEESLESDSYVRYEGYANSDSSSTTRISRNEADVNKKYSFEIDEEYLSAVESGDMETAQRLVDEAAVVAMKDTKVRNEKGKITKVYGGLYNKSVADTNSLIKVYHGTESEDFYEFDKQRRGQTDSSMYGRGYYFAFDTDYASDFGKNIREFYLNIKNPFFIDINAPSKVIAEFLESKGIEVNISDRNKQSHYFAKMFGSQKFTDTLIDLGYDGVIARTDEGEYFEAVAFHRNQMKLADAVTYDNDGNVIPISERFNLEKKDIRYSFGEEELDFGSYVSEERDGAENLKESGRAVGGLFEATRDAKLEEAEINRVLNKHLKNFKVTAELESHRARVAQIVELAERQDYVDGGAVVGEIATVMKDAVMKSDYIVDNHKEEREDIISRMRGVGKIYLTADQIASLEANDYSLNWFKKKMFGKVTVVSEQKFTKGSTESLNGLWHSLSEAYPQHFSADTLSNDMPLKMMKVLNGLKPDVVGADEYFMMSNDEVAIELASNVISDIIDLKYKKLSDEKIKAEVKKLREKQTKSMQVWYATRVATEKFNNIEKLAAGFYKKLTKPNKNESVPEELRKPMLELLNSLDFTKGKIDNRSTTRIKDAEGNWVTVPNENKGQPTKHDQIWQVRMKVLAEALMGYGGLTQNPETKDITLKNDAVRGFEIDAKLIADMNELAEGSGAKNLYKMSDEEIINLYSVLYRLRNEISQMNKLNANKFKAQVQELGQATVSELKAKGENKLLKSKANKLLFYSTADALTYFSQFGEAGMSVYDELREGYDKYILNINKVRLFTKDNLDEKKIKEWSKESFDFKLKSGDKVTLTVPQLMTLYLLDKRKQARGHLYDNPDSRGQITVEDSKGNKETVIVENDDIILMTAKLKPEQIKCAEKLQSFLENEVAEWGNEITMRRYLYRAFTVKDYFPIKVDGVSYDTTDATASIASFYAVANPGFSKRTQEGAHKPLVIGDVFDVFAEHCGNMAMFNGMSEALSDAMRWYNFRMGNSEVKRAIRDNLSQDALNWFERFIQDLNGRGQKASDFDKTVKKMVGVTKSALIWGNMKVVAQQPTAYFRALNVIDPKYLADPRVFKKGGVEKAMKHCPTAMYKSWGFYTTDVGRSARNLILNTGTVYDKAKDVGFFLAGKADELTWGRLWNACELQVLDTTELTRSSEGFNEAVAELLRKVIDETQVVDTPFHRSQVRRDTSAMAQVYSAFMDEPIKAYNMWMRAVQSGDGKKILRTAVAFTTTVVVGQALVKALWDLFIRYNPEDDEDGEKKFDDFLRLYAQSLVEDMNPLNLHPMFSKLTSFAETVLHNIFPNSELFSDASFGTSSLDTTAITDLTNTVNRLFAWARGENNNRTWYGYAYDISKVIGDFSGIGVNRVLQDVVGFVNLFLPADKKVTKTEYSNTAVSKFAVNSLLNGNKRDYELWYEELLSRNRGDREKADKQIASALSKSNDERVRAAYDARSRGDIDAIRSTHQVLVDAGFNDNVIIKGTASYKSQYESYVKKVAKAQIEGDGKAEKEALNWIKEQGVFNNVYEEEIEEAKEKLIADGEVYEDEEMFDNGTMVNALKNSGAEDFAEMLEDRLADCETEEQKAKVKSSVKYAVTSEYKLSYFTAYEQGDSAELKRIEDVLISTGLYGSNSTELWKATKEWIKSGIKSGYENAYSIGDPELMKHYERMLYNSNVYSSDTDLKKKLEEWRNGQK